MRYRLTCLTPTLVGDGQRLSPIDYMVWKDHVNVLDQNRIFQLLAKGSRLDSYLTQLKKAEKLDFASWGGFAQNYADRRIPFEHASLSAYWQRTHSENLFIPTFARGAHGAYLPASALKGALRTSYLQHQVTPELLNETAAKAQADGRVGRRAVDSLEQLALGGGGADVMRVISAGDSQPIEGNPFRVYLLRVSTLQPKSEGRFELGWKQSPRGTAKRVEDGTPIFAEMAPPGLVFEGEWHELAFLLKPEIGKAMRRRRAPDPRALFKAVNESTANLLAVQDRYAEWAGFDTLRATLGELKSRLEAVQQAERGCVFELGWGGGIFSKTIFRETQSEAPRAILKQAPFYARAIASGLPFPKTRKVVFLADQPAALPGYVHLETVSKS